MGRGSAPLSDPTLVIQTAFLGDVVLTTPLIAELLNALKGLTAPKRVVYGANGKPSHLEPMQ